MSQRGFILACVLGVPLAASSVFGQGGTGRETAATAPTRKTTATKKPTSGSKPRPSKRKGTNQPPSNAVETRAPSAAETAFWNLIKDSTKPDDFRSYLNAYPNGALADLARERVKTLEHEVAKEEKIEEVLKEEERKRNEAAQAKSKELPQKEAGLREAVRLNANSDNYSKLGSFLREQGRWAEAEAVYRQMLQLNPNDSNTVGNLAEVLVKQNKQSEADSAWHTHIALKPDDWFRLSWYSVFLEIHKRFAEAEVVLEE